MSDTGYPPAGTTPPFDQPPPGSEWPQQDSGETSWDIKADGNRRRPTTSEQAVPWLIGLVLALAGMTIVLLALIFSSDNGLLPAYGTSSPSPTLAQTPRPQPSPSPTPEATVTPDPTATPAPTPAFAPLEILFMQRTSKSGPSHLFSHDFAGQATPEPLARDDRGVDHYSWAADGMWGVALVDGNPLMLNPGHSAHDLGDGTDAVFVAQDGVHFYALQVTRAGVNDRAELLVIDSASGAAQSIHTWTYVHPTTYQEEGVKEAQFADEGGFDRLYVTETGQIVAWVLGAPTTYIWDPATGTDSTTNHLPFLWSPNGELRVEAVETGNTTRLAVKGLAGEERGAVTISGYVSHLRWSSLNNEVVFTITGTTSSGALAQDLYLWDLVDGKAPLRLTQDMRSLGGEFREVAERWRL